MQRTPLPTLEEYYAARGVTSQAPIARSASGGIALRTPNLLTSQPLASPLARQLPHTNPNPVMATRLMQGWTKDEFQNIESGLRQYFRPIHLRTMLRWMKLENVYTRGLWGDAFDRLLADLGFDRSDLSAKLCNLLAQKTQVKISWFGRKMRDDGTITVFYRNRRAKVIVYEAWTDAWLSAEWDGSWTRPTETQVSRGNKSEGEEAGRLSGGGEEEEGIPGLCAVEAPEGYDSGGINIGRPHNTK